MSTEAAPVQAGSSVVAVQLDSDCQHFDHDLVAFVPTVMMVRTRRGGYESSEWLGLTAVMTSISAVHQKAARALFRLRKSGAVG